MFDTVNGCGPRACGDGDVAGPDAQLLVEQVVGRDDRWQVQEGLALRVCARGNPQASSTYNTGRVFSNDKREYFQHTVVD